MVEALGASGHTITYVGIGARGIHQRIAYQFGVAPRFHRGTLIAQTQEQL